MRIPPASVPYVRVARLQDLFAFSVQHGVPELDCIDLREAHAFLELRDVDIADADMRDLPFFHKLPQRIHGLFDRHLAIWIVHEVEVDMVGAKPFERGIYLPQDVFPAVIYHARTGCRIAVVAELRDKERLFAVAILERPADKLLRSAFHPIDRCRIDHIDAFVEKRAQRLHRTRFISPSEDEPIGILPCHGPGAGSQRGEPCPKRCAFRIPHMPLLCPESCSFSADLAMPQSVPPSRPRQT